MELGTTESEPTYQKTHLSCFPHVMSYINPPVFDISKTFILLSIMSNSIGKKRYSCLCASLSITS